MNKAVDMRRRGGEFRYTKMGRCDNCPIKMTLGEKLSNLGRTVVPACLGSGPIKVMTGGAIWADSLTGTVREQRDEPLVCPAELVPDWQWYESFFQSRYYDAYERAVDALIEVRPDFPGEALKKVEHPLINNLVLSGVLRSHPESTREATRKYVNYYVDHPDELPELNFGIS